MYLALLKLKNSAYKNFKSGLKLPVTLVIYAVGGDILELEDCM